MSLPRILYNDLSPYTFESSFGASAEGYTELNLKNYIPSSKWIGDPGLVQNYNLKINLGSVKAINTIIIENHNFDSCISGSIIIESADDAVYATNLTTEAMYLESSSYLFSLELSPTINKRYLRINYSGSFYENPYIGNIFIGEKLSFNFPYTYGYKTKNYEYNTVERTTLSGLKRSSQPNSVNKILYELDFKYQNDSTKTNFINFIKGIRGKSLPFYYLDIDDNISYVNMESDYQPIQVMKHSLNDINKLKMKGFNTETISNDSINLELITDDDYVITVE